MTLTAATAGVTRAALPAALLAGLTAVYLFTYQGTIRSGDETFLASGAQSLSRLGYFQTGAVFGDRPDGLFNLEPGQAVVGAGLDTLARWAGVGSFHTLFLLNVYATALTAVAVYALVRQQGSGPGVALGAGLLYGLATMAWPNTKFYFRDPLAVAWATWGVWVCEAAGARQRWWVRGLGWALGLGLLALGVLTKQTVIFVAAAVLLAAAARALRDPAARRPALLGLALAGGLALVSLFLPADGAWGRLSLWRYLQTLTPADNLGEILTGLLVSPGKGLFTEAPVLLLALGAVPVTLKRAGWPRLITPWASLALLVLAVPLYRNTLWWGGIGWGVRHLLPAVPLLVAAGAPALAALAAPSARWQRWAVGGLIALSVIIQAGAVTGSLVYFYDHVAAAAPGGAWTVAIWDGRYSEAVGYWQSLWAGQPAAFAWVRLMAVRPAWSAALVAGGLAALALLAGAAGRALYRRPAARAAWASAALAAVMMTAVPYVFLRWLYPDPDYVAWRTDFRAAADTVAQRARPDDVILLRGYLHPLWLFVLNYADWPAPWYAFSPISPAPAEAEALRAAHAPEQAVGPDLQNLLTEQVVGRARRLWLVADRNAPAGDLRLEAWWLAEHIVPAGITGELTQVGEYAVVTPQAGDWQALQLDLGPALRLDAWGLLPAGRTRYTAGDIVPVALRWRAADKLPADYTVGLYVLDAGGAVVAQRDSQPVDGFRPTTGWAPGEVVQDLHGLVLPEQLPAGRYQVLLAVYDGQTMQRLPAAAPDNLVPLAALEIGEPGAAATAQP